MRVSVPTIPKTIPTPGSASSNITRAAAIERIATFLAPGNVTILSGAGVSVDSGIRAYRGKDGRYMNPNYKPIFYHELVDESEKGFAFRQRYWHVHFLVLISLRSYLGYPPVRDALPNTTHYAIAALQYTSHVSRLVTQNVDGLDSKAMSSIWPASKISTRILELHGTLHRVSCKHDHVVDRNLFQEWLAGANPRWAQFMENLERTGQKLRTNPDGDVNNQVEIEGASYEDFVVPDCPSCFEEGRRINMHKPHLIFFGESIPAAVKDKSFEAIELADRLFIVGTTLATYSAFRLLKRAIELGKPVLMLNVGPTRADTLTPPIEKIELPTGVILRDVVRMLAGSRATEDPVLVELLSSGIVKPPPRDDDDRAPRASG
ncbi:DHS-like NAD/FAD-binding domain-containing protein [Fomitiporia mediterranea MF3/22]|uniref:DHS-like NAD/FAD-binding domain-containing protein n=1 Tax=Fomitiporia mediterranea (strain MF3/22) TaxID=694068 RepID=UPI000440849F|nr:DHS-like NAD/FAD-binding domain-containing protein [Fomitiporia mediterranea MF3/22]EJD00489.1 DHS-like NAD/FAD-binding domain-containing protein [Fomitiporia mediterranea MF3/22]